MALNSLSTASAGFPSRLPARWQWRAADTGATQHLAAELGLPPLLARILTARGLGDPDAARLFLRPSLGQLQNPLALKGMDEAVKRLGAAMRERRDIRVYGDYDVDGVTATAILLLTLEELGCQAGYYIPHRLSEGYGLNMDAVEQLAQDGAQLIVTVDCGITAVAEVRRARELGLEIIITDHHEPGPELPPADAVINPKQAGCAYPDKSLSGAGVAFKLAHALLKRYHPDPDAAREFLKSLLDLAALGTVADIVPTLGENRAIIAHGLERLRLCKRAGLMHLMNQAQLSPSQIDSGAISYFLAPRLNAAGRTEHAMFGVELLLTRDQRRARDLARQLESFNVNRREIEQGTLEEAMTLVEAYSADPVIIVAQDGWHQGVLGIVASRILNQCYRPTIVIGIDGDTARGSGRSVPEFDLHEALRQCAGHLLQFGGHKMAAGVELKPDQIGPFREAINRYAETVLTEDKRRPLLLLDAAATAADLTPETVSRLTEMAPYGPDNTKPVVVLEGYRLIEEPRLMKQRHMKLTCAGPDGRLLSVVGWGLAGRIDELHGQRGVLRLAGTPFINTFNGRTSIELELKDFQVL